MNSEIVSGLIIGGFAILWSLYCRFFYTKCEGECIESRHAYRGGYRAQYSYKNPKSDSGEIVTASGVTLFRPTPGKSYKIFVSPKNPNRVVAYNFFVTLLVLGILIVALAINQAIFYYQLRLYRQQY